MDVCVNTFHVGKRNFLTKYHLIECANEEGIKESAMENSQSNNATDEFKVIEMLWVDARVGVDLQSVIVMC